MGLLASLLVVSSSSRPTWERDILMIGKIRIQILTAIVLLGAISGYAIFADMVEVATSTIAGMTALGMKVLDND